MKTLDMTKRPITVVGALLLLAAAAATPAQESAAITEAMPERPPFAREVAEHYGLAAWPDVGRITFTFVVGFADNRNIRAWDYSPVTDRVSYRGHNMDREMIEVEYVRGDVVANEDADKTLRQVDRWFINDSYWLLFPFRFVWDEGVTVTDDGMQPLPLGDGEAHKVTMSYGPDVGYTPGDRYEFWVGDDMTIQQMRFTSGSATGRVMTSRWLEHERIGGLLLPTRIEAKAIGLTIEFIDLAVEGRAAAPAAEPAVAPATTRPTTAPTTRPAP